MWPAMPSGTRALSLARLRRRKELAQLAISFFRRFVRKIVPARKRLAGANVGCIARPNLHRLVVAADAAGRAPQQQHRTGNLASGGEILAVHGEVDAVGGAVVLAHGVDGRGIAEVALVFGERRRVEEAQALLGLGELLLDEI